MDTVLSLPLEQQAQKMADYSFNLRIQERGTVEAVGDGIIWIKGLPSARMDQLVLVEDGSEAFVFRLTSEMVGAIMLRQTPALKSGLFAYLPGQGLSIPVGDALLGRVVDPLGYPLDDHPSPACTAQRLLDTLSPGIIDRDFVVRPLYTGTKVVDTMLPIGRGQRQLLIGDTGVGKSALALDAVIHQRNQNVRCVYVLIGQKRSAVVHTIETLRRFGALAYTTIVVAEGTATPGLKYLAPFAGCTIAEEWTYAGHDTLVVYDDLTTHARTYRELSLLLRRPPGREAFPSDIFYLHARLLERSVCLSPAKGGGSMTALPIVETEQGEIAAYIPTNLISITDGQIYFDAKLAAHGIRPAIDITRSVSRIGGKAQHPAIKSEAGRMKLDYLQFLELEVFTHLGAKLEAAMELRIKQGRLLRETLKQVNLAPLSAECHLAWLIAFNERLLDAVPTAALKDTLKMLMECVAQSSLDLEKPRDVWVGAVKEWLKRAPCAQGEIVEPAA